MGHESALARWSRRKITARTRERSFDSETGPSPVKATSRVDVSSSRQRHSCAESPAREPAPPAIEQLGIDSDFRAFLREDVEPLVRRAALRKLWMLDPVFSDLDGLVDYAEDFSDRAKAADSIRTGFRVASEIAAKPSSLLAGYDSSDGGADAESRSDRMSHTDDPPQPKGNPESA